MRTNAFLFKGILLLFVLSGCTSVKRFKTAEFKGQDNRLVDVELFHTRLSGEPVLIREKNLWTLSANAQARLVQILDERFSDNEHFLQALAGSYGANELQVEEYTRKDLRMVFNIQKSRDYARLNDSSGRFSPADRIEYLRLSLKIPDSYRLRFNEWNRYVTEYGEIEIADVSFSKNFDLSLDASPLGQELGSGGSLARNEKQVISRRYLKLNGSISDHGMVIESEGTREGDLTGNVVVDVSMAFAGYPEIVVIPVFTEPEPGSGVPEVAALEFIDVVVPAMEEAPDTLFATLTLDYIYRHVQSGWLTFAEWDDQVEYYQGQVSKKVTLFPKKDYLPGLYCIGTEQGGKSALKFRKSPEKEYLLQFGDRRDASRFLDCLLNPARPQDDPVIIGSIQLIYNGTALTPGALVENQLRVLPVY